MPTDDLGTADQRATPPEMSTSTAPARTKQASAFSALRHRDFTIFWIAAVVSNAGGWMQIIALPAIVYDITGKATWLGLVSLAGLIPSVIVTPMSGALADRFSRRALLMVTQSVLMSSSFALWALYSAGHLKPWMILVVSVVNGAASGLNFPVWNAFIPLLVPPSDLVYAIRLNSMQFTAGRVIGPTMAAAVIGISGPGAAIFVNAVTFLLVLGALVIVNPRSHGVTKGGESVWASVSTGAQFMWKYKPLRMVCLLALVNSMFGQVLVQLAPAVSNRVFEHPSTDNAELILALGFGSMIASVLVVTRGDLLRRSHQTLFVLASYVLGLGALSVTHSWHVGLVFFAVVGYGQLSTAVMCNTLVQQLSPESMRGRAVSFYMLGAMTGSPLGALITGRIADTFTMRTALFIDAIAVTVIGVAILWIGSHRWLDTDEVQGVDDPLLAAVS
ncbi:MAG: MFS transporter [Acidimicrobiia bacterium]